MKTYRWQVFGLIILMLLVSSPCSCKDKSKQKRTKKDIQKQKNKKDSGDWVRQAGIIYPNLASTSSIVLTDGTIRCYFVEDARIFYIESKDGKKFGDKISTNISIDNLGSNAESLLNPAILRLRSGRFMLLFNTNRAVDDSSTNVGNTKLHLAYSDDGLMFEYEGEVADSDKDHYAVLDQIDAVLLPDGSIRIYGVNNGISTALSKDGGKTWITDGFQLIEEAANEPDVHLTPDDNFEMFYTVSADQKDSSEAKTNNKDSNIKRTLIKRAVSKDGLNWKLTNGNIITLGKKNEAVSNPNYISFNNRREFLYFSESSLEKDHRSVRVDWCLAIKAKD